MELQYISMVCELAKHSDETVDAKYLTKRINCEIDHVCFTSSYIIFDKD